jgi:NO-binding membrane sensor protein with MHYT domain
MQSTVEQAGSRGAQRVRAFAWAAAIALWLIAAKTAGDRLGMQAFYGVHGAVVAGFGLWLLHRAAAGRPVAAGHPAFGAWAGVLALIEAVGSAAMALGAERPLWYTVLRGGLAVGLAVAELRHVVRPRARTDP